MEEDLEEEIEHDPHNPIKGGAMHIGDGPIPTTGDDRSKYGSIGFDNREGPTRGSTP